MSQFERPSRFQGELTKFDFQQRRFACRRREPSASFESQAERCPDNPGGRCVWKEAPRMASLLQEPTWIKRRDPRYRDRRPWQPGR